MLKDLKDNSSYRVIPVVIYSTSDETGDICTSYSLYANSYITKTFDIVELFEKIKYFGQYWIKSVELPDIKLCNAVNKEKK